MFFFGCLSLRMQFYRFLYHYSPAHLGWKPMYFSLSAVKCGGKAVVSIGFWALWFSKLWKSICAKEEQCVVTERESKGMCVSRSWCSAFYCTWRSGSVWDLHSPHTFSLWSFHTCTILYLLFFNSLFLLLLPLMGLLPLMPSGWGLLYGFCSQPTHGFNLLLTG